MDSLKLLREIAQTVDTWHHHHHILLDLARQHYPDGAPIHYCEIGCYAGASSCLMLQRPNTVVCAVDVGWFHPPETVRANCERFNPHGNRFHYIVGDSHDPETVAAMQAVMPVVEILFIDGMHEYADVVQDFNTYGPFVAPDGFCVFDDYSDPQYAGLHRAVDDISAAAGWQALGTFENTLGARGFPAGDTRGNCYVMRRAL